VVRDTGAAAIRFRRKADFGTATTRRIDVWCEWIRTMPHLGRVVIDETGVIIRADRNFKAMIRLDDALIGRNMLDFTAPADRERCIFLLDKLARDGLPVSTVKRMIRADDTHMWVCNHLALCQPEGGSVRIEISAETTAPPSDWVDPAELLQVARRMIADRAARAAEFSPSLFIDHAWDILLAAYVHEAEGVLLRTVDLHAMAGLSHANAGRWICALHAEGLVEYERGDGTALATTPIQLSAAAHRKFEHYLSDAHRRSMLPVPAAGSDA
jgi:hypothetical protein